MSTNQPPGGSAERRAGGSGDLPLPGYIADAFLDSMMPQPPLTNEKRALRAFLFAINMGAFIPQAGCVDSLRGATSLINSYVAFYDMYGEGEPLEEGEEAPQGLLTYCLNTATHEDFYPPELADRLEIFHRRPPGVPVPADGSDVVKTHLDSELMSRREFWPGIATNSIHTMIGTMRLLNQLRESEFERVLEAADLSSSGEGIDEPLRLDAYIAALSRKRTFRDPGINRIKRPATEDVEQLEKFLELRGENFVVASRLLNEASDAMMAVKNAAFQMVLPEDDALKKRLEAIASTTELSREDKLFLIRSHSKRVADVATLNDRRSNKAELVNGEANSTIPILRELLLEEMRAKRAPLPKLLVEAFLNMAIYPQTVVVT